jgi:hypothetical protein
VSVCLNLYVFALSVDEHTSIRSSHFTCSGNVMMWNSALARCTKGRSKKLPTIHIGDRRKIVVCSTGDRMMRVTLMDLLMGHQTSCATKTILPSALSML